MNPVRIGDYRLLAFLGQGGMGRVWLGQHPQNGMLVAIKRARSDALEAMKAAERLESEARLTRRLAHPNIVGLVDWFRDDGELVLVMEYVHGKTLGAIIEGGTPWSWHEVAPYAHQLAAALAHVHRMGVVLKDCKPENIIINRSRSTLVLIDLGAAIDRSRGKRLTQTGLRVFTIGYDPPELEHGPPGDVYQAAVVLIEWLVGVLYGPLVKEWGYHGAQQEIERRLEALRVPTDVSDLLVRCLCKDESSRPRDGIELRGELLRLWPGDADGRPAPADEFPRAPQPEEATLAPDELTASPVATRAKPSIRWNTFLPPQGGSSRRSRFSLSAVALLLALWLFLPHARPSIDTVEAGDEVKAGATAPKVDKSAMDEQRAPRYTPEVAEPVGEETTSMVVAPFNRAPRAVDERADVVSPAADISVEKPASRHRPEDGATRAAESSLERLPPAPARPSEPDRSLETWVEEARKNYQRGELERAHGLATAALEECPDSGARDQIYCFTLHKVATWAAHDLCQQQMGNVRTCGLHSNSLASWKTFVQRRGLEIHEEAPPSAP